MLTPNERQKILEQLHTLATADVVRLWRASSGADLDSQAFRELIVQAYPEIATQYATIAADLATEWYDASGPELSYQATPAPAAPVEQYAANARFALTATGEIALTHLTGAVQRAVWNGARDTIATNVEAESGARWARYASANACAFCRVMASRGAVYASEAAATTVVGRGKEMSASDRRARARGETRDSRHRFIAGGRRTRRPDGQSLGDKYHNSCRCISVEVRPGKSYEPPSYVERWQQDYIDASRAVQPGAGAGDLKDILAHMRANTNALR